MPQSSMIFLLPMDAIIQLLPTSCPAPEKTFKNQIIIISNNNNNK